MFRFTKKSDEEMNQIKNNLIEPGIYDFEVIKATEKTSKSGNEMLELVIKVWDKEGKEKIIYDYLLEALSFKIKHFCESVGLEDSWQNEGLKQEECLNRNGKCRIIIQKDKTGKYGDINSVQDYIKDSSPTNEIEDDDVPF